MSSPIITNNSRRDYSESGSGSESESDYNSDEYTIESAVPRVDELYARYKMTKDPCSHRLCSCLDEYRPYLVAEQEKRWNKYHNSIDYNDIKLSDQPLEFKKKLFKHQLASIYSMEDHEVNRDRGYMFLNIGINADMTGYGKTLSMLGLIKRDKMPWDCTQLNKTRHLNNICGSNYISDSLHVRTKSTLLLCSVSIMKQWTNEINNTDLTFQKLTRRSDIDKFIKIDEINVPDIVIVSPTMINYLSSVYNKTYKRFIFDEPASIKVSNMNPINAGFYWYVTATPDSLYRFNNHSRSNFVREFIDLYPRRGSSVFKNALVYNQIDFVKQSFTMPETVYKTHKCYDAVAANVRGMITDNIFNMVSAGNIRGAIEALGGGESNNIIEVVKNKKMKEIVDANNNITMYTDMNDRVRAAEWEVRRKRIEEQIIDLERRFTETLQSSCNICMDDLVDPVLEPNCQNVFCGKCLLSWLKVKNTCPLCRSNVKLSDLTALVSTSSEHKSNSIEAPLPTKLDMMMKIIKRNKGGKFLIFSDYDVSFYSISCALHENGIKYALIKGAIGTIERQLDDYRHGSTDVLFLNSRYNSSGINLVETTDIILIHDIDDTKKDQIIGRANRLGRKISLIVHTLKI